jgi:basic membrane protein A and related proteins
MHTLKHATSMFKINLLVLTISLPVLFSLILLMVLSGLSGSVHAASTKVGLITSTDGLEDKSINWLSYQGLLRAQDELGVTGTVYTSTEPSDYIVNVEQCVADGNDLCIGVGFLLADAIYSTSQAYPETKFALVDVEFEEYNDNLRGIVFKSDDPAFMAGVLSGMMSESKVVGDIGGMEIPPVTIFTLPYRNGVLCTAPQATVLLEYTYDFVNPDLGAEVAQDMISQGADVIFAAAGGTGIGAVLTATQSSAWGIGVDTDFYTFAFDNGTVPGSDKLLTSVIKKFDNAVFSTIEDVISGTFTPGTRIYTLAEDGVGLAPFHETDSLIPLNIKERMEQVKFDLLAGRIDPYQPYCPSYIFLPVLVR